MLELKFKTFEETGLISIDDPDFILLTKVYRLKHFNKCPNCDTEISQTTEYSKAIDHHWYLNCDICGWEANFTETEMVRVDNIDPLLIKICRR